MVRRGILVLLAVLMALTVATVARAGWGTSYTATSGSGGSVIVPAGCSFDPKLNIIWCSY
jgi:hypothetical protein